MSLGIGALEVSGGPNANSGEEVSMAILEAGPPLKQPLTDTVTLNKFSGEILTHDNTYPREKRNLRRGNNCLLPSKEGRRGSKNPQRFAKAKLIGYDQHAKQQSKTALTMNTKEVLQDPKGHPVGHVLQWRRPLASST